jgi:hypothetical protein
MLKSGQVWKGVFATLDATGALATPSVGPVGQLWVNAVANGASVTIGGTNPYTFSVTLPTLTAGDCVSMYMTATISSIATAMTVAEDVADTKRVSDLNDLGGTAQTGDAYAVVADTTYGNAKLARTGADSDTLKSLSDQIDGVVSEGAGSETVTITCLDSTSNAVEGVAVWVTSDIAGTTVEAGTLYSNSSGQIVVYLDVGTHYVWRQGGQNWTNPQTITVTDA